MLRRSLPVSHYVAPKVTPKKPELPGKPDINGVKTYGPGEFLSEAELAPRTKGPSELYAEEHPIKNFFFNLITRFIPIMPIV
jgi:hypothetical protein